ncbi:glutamate racemase [Testudinibacter aquarius]|uniref:Glutamate racemase n=1 Tax=Testudinibacter aquarius TaxID=1524974 RepID=A0A4V2W1P0_9PAST|nr:glutamate racemase [Testudinibacter aquarius]KAE9527839.1 glutamate racemase [Testudinibacter aquarius]TCV84889.1 glutamate racemase [Testudinibacter aquarius]TNG90587.1 glutamate racemase [Testudinibacter aquarius]
MNKATKLPTILVFDSGVGGLTVYHEIKQLLPNNHYFYCLDNAFFPYSEKTEQQIIDRTLLICRKLVEQYPIDLVVIACNTASTVVLPTLRQHLPSHISIVGTVPAIKPAAKISQTKHIGLLATKGTVKRAYTEALIKAYATDCQVEKIGTTELVELAENKLRGDSVDLGKLRNIIKPWIELKQLDTVIWGCTHFPLLENELKLCLPQVKYFVDSGKAVAKRVKFLLEEKAYPTTAEMNHNQQNLIFATAAIGNIFGFNNMMQRYGFSELKYLD